MEIQAQVKSEGSKYCVRLYDNHGLELPAFVYEARYGLNMEHDTAIHKVYAVASFINSLSNEAKNDLYQHLTR